MAKKHCLEILLEGKLPAELPPVVIAFGEDAFLRRETISAVMQHAGLEADDVDSVDGEETKWIDVHDELATMSLFAEETRRVAVVSSADRLVKDSRAQIEKWCESPAAASLLILQLATFPSNTKLYKIADKTGLCISCTLTTGRSKSPSATDVKKFIQIWGDHRHGVKLSATQAGQIMDAVGTDSGLLHQELAKLALFADEKGRLSEEQIRANVGSWRTRTMWEIADAVVDGRVADAMLQLQRVFAAGEHPAAVIPQISWSLRRFGNAANLLLQARRTGRPLSAQSAIGQCGFWGNDQRLAEQRLKRLGLKRGSQILDWLLELDLKIKGSHSQPDRAIFALEELCLRFL